MTVIEYCAANGRCPYREWLDTLDKTDKARVSARIQRFREGNLGDHKAGSNGVCEARMFFGPGYRIYFGREVSTLLVLLLGGDKQSQKRDIIRAGWLWSEYLMEKRHGSTS